MDPDNSRRSADEVSEHSQRSHHCDAREEVRNVNHIILQERDDLREYARNLEELVVPRFDVNGTNLADIFVSQKNAYLERVKDLEKAIADVERAHSYDTYKFQREREELQHQYEELHHQIVGPNGYKERLESAYVAIELANATQPPDIVDLVRQLAEVTKERDEFNRESRRLGARIEELHVIWNTALSEVEDLRRQKAEWGNLQDNSIALQEANRENERLRSARESDYSYHVEASNRQVVRLQEEKIVWEDERLKLEGHTAELSLRIRMLEDMLAAAEAKQESSDIPMSDVGGDEETPSPQVKVLGDAVWREWSNRLWDHIQAQPQEVEDLYRLAAANLYRPGGAFPDSDLSPESPRQQFPGVTWVKKLVELASKRPVAPMVEESVWREWANQLKDFVLTVPNEISTLYRLAEEGKRMAGAKWIRQLIAYAAKLPTTPDRPSTLKEYQLGVEVKDAKARIEELEKVDKEREQTEEQVNILIVSNDALKQTLEAANSKIEDLQQEISGIPGRFEDEIDQLSMKLQDSYEQRNLFKSLYESGAAHKEKLNEIEQLRRDLHGAYERGNRFVQLYEKGKALSDEHEKVWQQKFDKEVAGADKHAAGLVEEAETLQGRLNGAHGVIADLEKEISRLRKLADRNAADSGLGESISGSGSLPKEGRQGTPSNHEVSESEEEEEEEESESEEMKTIKTDLYNTLEEVEELKLKLGFAERAFNDMKEEFERKIALVEDNAKEDLTEKERMEEKLRNAEEKFKRGIAAEVRRLEREGLLRTAVEEMDVNQPVEAEIETVDTGKGKAKGKGRKAAPGAPKPKKSIVHVESPPITPLESPLESPDILMKDDEEYRGPRGGRKGRKKGQGQGDEVEEKGSEGVVRTRRTPRATRNAKPVYTEVPLKVLLGKRRKSADEKRKVEEGGEGVDVHGDQEGDREEVKRRGSKMV